MVFDIQWNLLGRPADIGGAFQAGMERGTAARKAREQENALRAYAMNPADPNALNALTAVNPQMGMQLRTQALQQQRLTNQDAESKQERDAKLFAGLAANAKDAATWDSVVDQAVQMGYPNAARLKGQFSREARLAVMAAGGIKEGASDPTTLEQEYEFYNRIDPTGKMAQSYASSKANPVQWVRTEDANGVQLTPVPRSGGGGGASATASPKPQAIEYLRANPNLAADFDAKYGAGAAAAAMGQGGAGSQAPRPFP